MSVGIKGLHFKVADFIGLVNFECQSQNEVGNIDTFVLFKDCEKLYCMTIKWNSNQRLSYPLNFLPSFSKKKKNSASLLCISHRHHHHRPRYVLRFFPVIWRFFNRFLHEARAFIKRRPHPKHEAAQEVTRQYDTYNKNIMSFFMLNVWRSRPHPSLITSSNVTPDNNKKRARDNDTCDTFYL